MQDLIKQGDSVGARINVVADGVPAGWGEPVFDRLDADIAHAVMSINAVKGVEIGDGFASVAQLGSEHRDADDLCVGLLATMRGAPWEGSPRASLCG